LCPTSVIPVASLGLGATPEILVNAPYGTADVDIDEFQRRRLSNALGRTGWNISRTAVMLGVTRNTVRARIARYGLRSADDGEHPVATRADARSSEGEEQAQAGADRGEVERG